MSNREHWSHTVGGERTYKVEDHDALEFRDPDYYGLDGDVEHDCLFEASVTKDWGGQKIFVDITLRGIPEEEAKARVEAIADAAYPGWRDLRS